MYHPAVRISNRKTSAVRYVMNQNDNETKAKIILHERERDMKKLKRTILCRMGVLISSKFSQKHKVNYIKLISKTKAAIFCCFFHL